MTAVKARLASAAGAWTQADAPAGRAANATLARLKALAAAESWRSKVVQHRAKLAAQEDAQEGARCRRYPGMIAGSSTAAGGNGVITGRVEVPVWSRTGEIHFTLERQRTVVVVVPGAVGWLDPTTGVAVTRAAQNRVEATPTSQTTPSAIPDKAQN